MTLAPSRFAGVGGVWKFAAILGVSARHAFGERASLVGRMLFYAVILLIFSRLWSVIAESGQLAAAPRDFIWYLAITEWILLSQPSIHLDVEAEVRRGEVAYALTRPISYARMKVADAGGSLLLRMVTLGPFGAGIAFALAGGLPSDPRALGLAWVFGFVAAWITLCFHFVIGLCAFWLLDCSPVYWIWQKACFLLGGLMLPLDIYPDWLRAMAAWTPFQALLYGPARLAFGWDARAAAGTALALAFWGAVALALVRHVERRAVRSVEIGGG